MPIKIAIEVERDADRQEETTFQIAEKTTFVPFTSNVDQIEKVEVGTSRNQNNPNSRLTNKICG